MLVWLQMDATDLHQDAGVVDPVSFSNFDKINRTFWNSKCALKQDVKGARRFQFDLTGSGGRNSQ